MRALRKLLTLSALLFACAYAGAQGRVVLGDERSDVYLPLLQGQRVALFSNHSGIAGDVVDGKPSRVEVSDQTVGVPFLAPGDSRLGPHILDQLLGQGVNVTAIFSPEHGFRGTADAGAKVGSSVDEKTGVPILSLYEGNKGKPSAESMASFDVLVVDIQDVGLRYYTYYISMQKLMGACAEYGKKVVVFDRPNPNGFYVDGPVLDMKLKSGVGSIPVPIVHGLTLGELALMMNGEGWLEAGRRSELTVVPCLGYTHSTKYSLIVRPSPNIKCMRAVYLYSSTCFFEGLIAIPGRGTDYPFEVYGHPDMQGCSFSFTPVSMPGAQKPRLEGRKCMGVDLRTKPIAQINSEGVNMEYAVDAFQKLGSKPSFIERARFFDLLTGQVWVREALLAGQSAAQIKQRWQPDVQAFLEQRKPYLLYPDN